MAIILNILRSIYSSGKPHVFFASAADLGPACAYISVLYFSGVCRLQVYDDSQHYMCTGTEVHRAAPQRLGAQVPCGRAAVSGNRFIAVKQCVQEAAQLLLGDRATRKHAKDS